MQGVDFKEFEKNAILVHAKLVQLAMKLEWLAYLRDNDDQSLRQTWDANIFGTLETKESMIQFVEHYIFESLPIPESELFPPFPYNEEIMEKMCKLTNSTDETSEHCALYEREPEFVTLILALETREKFVAFYKEEYERSQNNKGEPDYEHYRNLTHQFIEQLADRLYAK